MKLRRVSFGRWLKERREAVQLTQMDLAKKLNYENPQIISNIERGFSALPSRRVCDFAHILQCNGLELELRRVLSSTKDEASVKAIETAIHFVPLIESLTQEHLTATQAIQAINVFRERQTLHPLKMQHYETQNG